MKWIIAIILMNYGHLYAQINKPVIYFIPGQGADSRQFKNLSIDDKFEIKHIKYFTPEKGSNMTDFARALATQIDTTQRFILAGVSLGGMLATEMGDFLQPEKIILISSAKCRNEFPGRYKIQKAVPIYRWVPPGLVKSGAKFLQPIVEPDRKYDTKTFKSMLNDKDPVFLKRTVAMIMEWDRTAYRSDIIHIHGDNDHTLPGKNIKYDFLIENGSHMMVFTKADEISDLINDLLSEID
ncbi:MAG TPA: alpha/beta hydrolase [Draconibacterium sp.]|nr:alpha/beta hydrolase [Draconibacterium sp.]